MLFLLCKQIKKKKKNGSRRRIVFFFFTVTYSDTAYDWTSQ